jgi:pimeloyl-ACP methyl ester carboxylesterase
MGCGLSQKADAYTVVQGPLEVEILQGLTEKVRQGSLLSALKAGSNYAPTLHLPAFDKIVHVGHSLGSQITQGFLVKYGSQSTAAILTGFTFPTHTGYFLASGFGLEYAATNDPELFGHFPSGYLVPATVNNIQNNFFHQYNASDPSGFSDDVLAYADSIKQPITVAAGVSTRGLIQESYAPDFAGPIQHMLGEFDWLVCGGDCKGDYDPATPQKVYPNATAIETYLQPGAGHGLPLHRNASAGFAVSLDFLERNGL